MLLVDLDKCIGCYACEVGCQQWHQVDRDKKRMRVQITGPHKVGDKLVTEYFPETTSFCDLCSSNRDGSLFCVDICPVHALRSFDDKDAVALLNSGGRYKKCRIQ